MIVVVVGFIVCVDFQNVDFGFIKNKSGDFFLEGGTFNSPMIPTTTTVPLLS